MRYPNRIAELRFEAELTQEQAAEAIGMSLGGYRKLEYGERRLKQEQIQALAKAFSCSEADFVDSNRTARVVGRIGAGNRIEPDFEQVPPEGLWTIDVPFSLPEGIIAFEVQGDSMLPRYDDGDVILVFSEQRRSTVSLLGEEVAVKTTDGHRYLKRLMRGQTPRMFNLESWNAKTIEDVSIEWIGEIYLTVRAGQIRRIEAKERRGFSHVRTPETNRLDGIEAKPLKAS